LSQAKLNEAKEVVEKFIQDATKQACQIEFFNVDDLFGTFYAYFYNAIMKQCNLQCVV